MKELQEEMDISTDLWGDFNTVVFKIDSKCMKGLNHTNYKVKPKDIEIYLF